MLEQKEHIAPPVDPKRDEPKRDETRRDEAPRVELEQLRDKPRNMQPLAIKSVMERVPLLLTVELGRAAISLKDLRALRQGQVVALDQIVGEPLGIYANGQHLGMGDVVSIGKDQYGIRITALAEASDKPADPES